MSPEYTVILNPKTQKGEIEATPLPDENPRDYRYELLAAHLATACLHSGKKYDLSNAAKALTRVLPQDTALQLVCAAVKGVEGASVKFERTEPKKYDIVDVNIKLQDQSEENS